MHYEITIDKFSGPLDLLLHLIKQSDIDIYDISLEDITNQYMDYIKKMEELNLDVASEYLVMASELLEYKSRSLLPRRENDEDTYEEDPKEELIKKLIDYKKYKEVTETFKELESIRSEVFTKVPSNVSDYIEGIKNSDEITIDDLINAFKKFAERKELEKPLHTTVTTKELSVTERIYNIRDVIRRKGKVNFLDLFENIDKSYVIVTFLAILEMSKNREIVIIQDNNFDSITIKGSEL